MSTPTNTPRGTGRARTYLPEAAGRAELLDFAGLIRELEAYFAGTSGKAALVDPRGKPRPIPDEVFRILDQVTNALAAGEGITIVPQGMSMTTQQAADFLGIARPTLVRLLEGGSIPFEKPNRHRRVKLQDLLDYQARSRVERRAALRDLARANLDAKVQVGNPAEVRRLTELDGE